MKLDFFNTPDEADVRIHGNGFLQAELPDGRKLHVWNAGDKNFPKQTTSTQIHTHNSPFKSTILHGKLMNFEYEMSTDLRVSNDYYDEYEAIVRHGKDTELKPTGRTLAIENRRVFKFSLGSEYDFPGGPNLYHETNPLTGSVITVVERTGPISPIFNPMVMVQCGEYPDNNFDRYAHQEYAYTLYSSVVDFLRG